MGMQDRADLRHREAKAMSGERGEVISCCGICPGVFRSFEKDSERYVNVIFFLLFKNGLP